MSAAGADRPIAVIGPQGQRLTIASLPSRNTTRWTAHRKAELVAAVCGGLLTIEEVCERYAIAREEFVSWQQGMESLGLRGLWVTHSQKHRALLEVRQHYSSGAAWPRLTQPCSMTRDAEHGARRSAA